MAGGSWGKIAAPHIPPTVYHMPRFTAGKNLRPHIPPTIYHIPLFTVPVALAYPRLAKLYTSRTPRRAPLR